MDDHSAFIKFLMLLPLLAGNLTASDLSTADKLYYRSQNLTTVPSKLNSSQNADVVTKVIFSHNNFQILKANDFVYFSEFPNLKYLFFDHNNISYIESKAFLQIPNLKFLDLSHNSLGAISNDLYDDLARLNMLYYINLKRNPIKKFNNIDKLVAKGVQVEYDGVLGREKKIKFRNRRVISYGSSVTNASDNLFVNDNYSNIKQKEIDKNELDNKEIDEYNQSDDDKDEEGNATMVHDKPVKAYVVDHKTDQTNAGNLKVQNNFLGSIIFNFLAAFLVLVALPVAMIIYYVVHRNDGIS